MLVFTDHSHASLKNLWCVLTSNARNVFSKITNSDSLFSKLDIKLRSLNHTLEFEETTKKKKKNKGKSSSNKKSVVKESSQPRRMWRRWERDCGSNSSTNSIRRSDDVYDMVEFVSGVDECERPSTFEQRCNGYEKTARSYTFVRSGEPTE